MTKSMSKWSSRSILREHVKEQQLRLHTRLEVFLEEQVPAQGEDLPLPRAPALSPTPWLDANARAWKKRNQPQHSCPPIRE